MAGIVNDSIGGMGGLGMFGGGYGAGGVIEGLLFGALLGNRRGFGGDGDGCCKCCEKMIDMHDHHDDHNHEVDEIHGVQMEVCAAERQLADVAMMLQKCCCDTDRDVLDAKFDLDRDILESKFDLSTQILNNRFESTVQFKDLTHDVDLQSCGINRNIDSVKFNQEIIAKDAAMQLADCCCKLENKIRDSIDATNKAACEGRELALKIDAKNDAKEAERERRALERQIDILMADKRKNDDRNEQNILNNFGTITDSLNKVVTALGNTAA